MNTIHTLNSYLSELLNPGFFSDIAINGIQVENEGEIEHIGFAVDASLESIDAASKAGCSLLVVHHGFWWGRPQAVTGAHRARIKALLDANIGLIAYHLPLDAHAEYGNNSRILSLLGITEMEPFGGYKGNTIGWQGRLTEPKSVETLAALMGLEEGKERFMILPFGNKRVGSIAVVSGGGTPNFPEAVEAGVDLFITGDADHQLYHAAREAGVNVLFGGHYHTETFGVKALEDLLAKEFEIKTSFFDIPTML
jgi:dinuclear metal center YbgI/SA1388 family protein